MSAQGQRTQQVTLDVAARPEWARGFDVAAIRGTRNSKKLHAPDFNSREPDSKCNTSGRFRAVELDEHYPWRDLCGCARCQAYWDEKGVGADV